MQIPSCIEDVHRYEHCTKEALSQLCCESAQQYWGSADESCAFPNILTGVFDPYALTYGEVLY